MAFFACVGCCNALQNRSDDDDDDDGVSDLSEAAPAPSRETQAQPTRRELLSLSNPKKAKEADDSAVHSTSAGLVPNTDGKSGTVTS
jgi:hypothetical protein